MTHARSRLLFRPVAFAVLISLLSACASLQQAQRFVQDKMRAGQKTRAQMLSSEGEQITMTELAALNSGFADRYMTLIADACDAIIKRSASLEERKLARQVRLTQVNSIYDIVTNADPFTQLLDLTLVVTLQSYAWIDEDQAEDWFGDHAPPLISASRRAREDIWKIAARVMKSDQLDTLDYLIWDWRRKNPDVQMVSYVRFDDFASSRGKSVVADVKTGAGLLAPVDEAKKAVDEVRLLGERAFYLGKRMPFLVNWQVESAVDNVLAEPQIKGMTDSVTTVSGSVDRVARSVDRLPQDIARERAALFDGLEQKRPMLDAVFTQYRGAVQETDRLAGTINQISASAFSLLREVQATSQALNGAMAVSDKTFMPSRAPEKPPAEPAKPFQIESYTESALAMKETLQEANRLVALASDVTTGPKMENSLKMMGALADQRFANVGAQGVKVLDAAFWRGALLMCLFFALLVLYRLFSHRLDRRRAQGAASDTQGSAPKA
jgi:hypothetical protein